MSFSGNKPMGLIKLRAFLFENKPNTECYFLYSIPDVSKGKCQTKDHKKIVAMSGQLRNNWNHKYILTKQISLI